MAVFSTGALPPFGTFWVKRSSAGAARQAASSSLPSIFTGRLVRVARTLWAAEPARSRPTASAPSATGAPWADGRRDSMLADVGELFFVLGRPAAAHAGRVVEIGDRVGADAG